MAQLQVLAKGERNPHILRLSKEEVAQLQLLAKGERKPHILRFSKEEVAKLQLLAKSERNPHHPQVLQGGGGPAPAPS